VLEVGLGRGVGLRWRRAFRSLGLSWESVYDRDLGVRFRQGHIRSCLDTREPHEHMI